MQKRMTQYGKLIFKAISYCKEDRVSTLAAALAYYTIFSLGSLLLICVAIAGLVFGNEAATGQILAQFTNLLGQDSAMQLQAMLQSANKPFTGVFSTIIGFIFLIIGTAGLFGELQESLNIIWKVNTQSKGVIYIIKNHLLTFAMALGIGFLLLVSLILTALLSALGTFIGSFAFAAFITEVLNFIFSLTVITLLFAMIFKFLPSLKIEWNEVWLGAFITASLFTIGKTILGLYLGMSHIASAYGSAGSLIVILIWIYYSTQILLFGAELTKVHAENKGKKNILDDI